MEETEHFLVGLPTLEPELVLILNLQDIADVSKICAFIESEEWDIDLLVVEVDVTFEKEINAVADKFEFQDVLVIVVKIEIVEGQ